MAEIVPRKGRLQVSKRGTHGFTDPSILESGGIASSKTDLYAVDENGNDERTDGKVY